MEFDRGGSRMNSYIKSASCVIGALAIFGVSSTSSSARTEKDLKVCQNVKADPDAVIRACSEFAVSRRTVDGRPAPATAMSSVHGLRGFAQARKGKHDLAIDDYNEALRYNASNSSLYVMRGLSYSETGEYAAAMRDYEKAIPMLRGAALADAYANRGIEYLRMGDDALAQADFQAADRLAPQSKQGYEGRRVQIKRWTAYLKSIQDSNDYANWSGPPLESYRRGK